jgi:hypothetical protein
MLYRRDAQPTIVSRSSAVIGPKGQRTYRIRNLDEEHERVAKESELRKS